MQPKPIVPVLVEDLVSFRDHSQIEVNNFENYYIRAAFSPPSILASLYYSMKIHNFWKFIAVYLSI